MSLYINCAKEFSPEKKIQRKREKREKRRRKEKKKYNKRRRNIIITLYISFPLFLNGDIIKFPSCLMEEKKNHDFPKKYKKVTFGVEKSDILEKFQIFPLY